MSNPSFLGVRPQTSHIDKISIGNLRRYDLVIVEEARKISTEDLQKFIEYVALGGRLVWTGDAGTELTKGDQLLFEYERPNGTDENVAISPWARKIGSSVVAFDEFISVDYIGNFCQLKTCSGTPFIGIFEAPDRSHDLVKAIRPDLKMYGDFAVVNLKSGSFSTIVLNVDFQSDLIADASDYFPTIGIEPFPECNDDKDNDGDGLIDYPNDPGCDSYIDDSEIGATPSTPGRDPECSDGRDNDNDGKIDYPNDECCLSAIHDDEASCPIASTECSDGIDNDRDGKTDYGDDPKINDSDCTSAADRTEGKRNLGRFFPIIVSTGLGEKVVYYSIPPEFFVSDAMPFDPETGVQIKYFSFIENMYFGTVQ